MRCEYCTIADTCELGYKICNGYTCQDFKSYQRHKYDEYDYFDDYLDDLDDGRIPDDDW